ncbi:MAG: 4-alpha-glucanotransferase [Propionibacteriaceae bacterium]|jgi:4-alpha-glucanotransferase|nr:4-alpha-glucanotransferase [Propionibacteriaceae bacterium]
MALSNTFLEELAAEFGIATEFWDWKGRLTEVSDETVIAILAAMDVDASGPDKARAALEEHRNKPWTRTLPPCIVMEQGRGWRVFVHVPHGEWVRLVVHTEDGMWRDVPQVFHVVDPRYINGKLIGEAAFDIPPDLPLGYHTLIATTATGEAEALLAVSPHFLGFPERLGSKRAWGYAVQLYSARSKRSWELGDLADMGDLATWSGKAQGADFMLVNPLHAAQVVPPIEPSPYLPASRRFINPLYIRPEFIAEYSELSDDERATVFQLKMELPKQIPDPAQICRDEVWAAKCAALRVIYNHGLRPARQMALNAFIQREGPALTQFATWCALSEDYGEDWREWPLHLRDPDSIEVASFVANNRDRVIFYVWLQWIADLQLRNAQASARDAGMLIGIMNDLAVGVGKKSSEAWTYGNLFASGVSVGAPPDHFNQKGQDWAQIAWRPDRLEELCYAPFRTMVAGLLRNSGGIRIDHVMGLFRLWWIPQGMPPTAGTYVRYNHEAAVGILVLEAYRAGALVVGEDLGVVEPWVRAYLRDRGVLGTSIAWFERDQEGRPLPPEAWREYCLASVTTHDLPPTAGYLAKSHVYLQEKLGLLSEPLEAELEIAAADQQLYVDMLRARGWLNDDDPSVEEIVLAMHQYLTATESRVLCAALTDAVGDCLTQNQPGTDEEYPNWRIPLSKPDGTPMYIEEVFTDERARRLAEVMNNAPTPLWEQGIKLV